MTNEHSSSNSNTSTNTISRSNSSNSSGAGANTSNRSLPRNDLRQARYWIGTIPESKWIPALPDTATYLRGQLEQGAGGFKHWQIMVTFPSKKTLRQVSNAFPDSTGHFEPTRSRAAEQYVWKHDTRIGEYFRLIKAI